METWDFCSQAVWGIVPSYGRVRVARNGTPMPLIADAGSCRYVPTGRRGARQEQGVFFDSFDPHTPTFIRSSHHTFRLSRSAHGSSR